MRYRYLGDRLTDPGLVGLPCDPVRRADGRCIVGRSKQLVSFRACDIQGNGIPGYVTVVVLRRRLRLAR